MSVVEKDLIHMPKREACRQNVIGILMRFDEHSLSATDAAKRDHDDLLYLNWLDDYTKSEVILMGFAVGANLLEGNAVSLVKYQENNFQHDEFIDDLAEWYHGAGATRARPSAKGAAYHLANQNYGIVTQQLSEFPNVVAFCGAATIGSQMGSVVSDLINIIEQYSDDFVE